jgi:phage tail-like protein
MNVNGSRFELLLGREDWGRCLDGDDLAARTLRARWDDAADGTSPAAATLPTWDVARRELSINPLTIALPTTTGEAPLTLDERRGAAADRYGNVYRIGADRRTLLVSSAGSRRESAFWPADPSDCAEVREAERLDFGPAAPPADAAAERYLALAATTDDYLVVAFAAGAGRGFLAFDLVAGGEPVRTDWPAAVPIDPLDMAARCGGGVWVLDPAGDGSRPPALWELDGRLAVVGVAQPEVTLEEADLDDFQPLTGKPRERAEVLFPGGLDLAASPAFLVDPVALEAMPNGAVLLLDRDEAAGLTRVVRLRREGAVWRADPSEWLDEAVGLAHDLVLAGARVYGEEEPVERLFVATATGNQARAFVVLDEPDRFVLRPAAELFPLRRFGGRALLAVRGTASYDSGSDAVHWAPIVHQPRSRFGAYAELVTPVFDSGEIGTVWDRVVLDGCIPPDTRIEVSSRVADERVAGAGGSGASPPGDADRFAGGWLPEPLPRLRSQGPELPWLRREAAPATRRESGTGSWELLLQQARGRYLQLRIRLLSESGLATPRIRALRAWSPRFSYPERFLPAAYREDEVSGSLLERWLANMESTLTHLEERVVNVEALFDPRAAPAEALAWLGEWLGVALDPAWDEERRRFFIEHAMEFYRWRGTAHGVRLALELAFAECADRSLFHPPGEGAATPRGIRIVEAFLARRIGAAAAGDAPGAAAARQEATGPRELRPGERWSPAERNAGLVDRWSRWLGRSPTETERVSPFPLQPPAGASAAAVDRWREFTAAALGFVPAAGAEERSRWQRFLEARYPTIGALRVEHGSDAESFSDVSLPRDWPANARRADDWRSFCSLPDPLGARVRWQDFLARRYRRIARLNREHRTGWPGFDVVALPAVLPESRAAQADWLQFERLLLPMHRSAHRFSVLLPVREVGGDPFALETRMGLARRIVELEKPAHTVFDVRFYWAFFRIGEARLGLDTQIGGGSRAPELIPDAVLGRAYIGASFVGGTEPPRDGDRLLIAC